MKPPITNLPSTLSDITTTPEYQAIFEIWNGVRAKRTGVPYINHINEGLILLDNINLSKTAKLAFCLHPLCQGNNELRSFDCTKFDRKAVLYAMEFRNITNAYLNRSIVPINGIELSPIPFVNDMILADKVQNYKDFIKYHKGTHPRSRTLDRYFKNWLTALGTDLERYQILADVIS